MTQEQTLSILKTGASVFLTGEPGSGKSYTVNKYVHYLTTHDIDPVITASTGIASTHIGGTTLHSWAGIGIANTLTDAEIRKIAEGTAGKRIRKTKVLIIDEISMIDALTLDLVEKVCRISRDFESPFGGLQVVLVGDFFQLPPISKSGEDTRFAFDSAAWKELDPLVCYITEQHRQEDEKLMAILNGIRQGSFDERHIDHIESCLVDDETKKEQITKLYSHNANVDHINDIELQKIPGKIHLFEMTSKGSSRLVSTLKKGCMSPEELYLKIGASVMFTKNNPKGGFVNGTLGKIVGFDEDTDYPIVKTRSGSIVETEPMDWTIEENGLIRAKVSQIPLRLAWAITIHKSQGMSLDAALIDLRSVFEYGQGYVALSRVRKLSGLHLLGYNEHSLRVDPNIIEKDEYFQRKSSETWKSISDLNELETQRLFDNFILSCKGSLKTQTSEERKKKIKEKKMSTIEKTLILFKMGKNIKDICNERGLTETTVISHLEKLLSQEKVSQKDILPLLESSLGNALPTIHRAFADLDTTSLTPIFEHFKGKYSYRDLQMARMMLE